MLLEGIFDPSVSVAEADLLGDVSKLYPEERTAIANAVKSRQQEFTAGRICARQAMDHLGLPGMAIPVGSDRAPIWPAGIAGSISHSTTRCVAAIGRHSDGIKALGLDLEEATPLDDTYAQEICTPRERQWLNRQQWGIRGRLVKAIFSAKECTYKCQYGLTRTMFGFEAIRIELNLADGHFAAYFEIDVPPFKTGDRLVGQIRLRDGYVVAGMTIR